ncbi:MAG: TusE/DsrC/DsvC family sulfur relay protein [Gammaproteobacteria bacterium]|nr:TusE/DsrC/DsvC family sulfur relay protein [Gammaproteobacteria bacterium]
MKFDIQGKIVETNGQGFLSNIDEWSEEFAAKLAQHEGIELFVDHWELIWYFRDYYKETQTNPTMRQMILTLGRQKSSRFRERKEYEKHIYRLFPTDPIHELCKLAGLPMPQPDT